MKHFTKTHKIIIALAACAVIGVGVAGTYAILTDATGLVVNAFNKEDINTHIEEDFPPQDVTPGTTLKKDAKIVNDGPSDAFIRARITISPAEAVTISGTDSKWVKGDDNWYYYTEVVAVGGKTTSIMTNVAIPTGLTENFDVTIYQEAVGTGQYKPGDTVPFDFITSSFANVTTD